jgi:hypothetical protein
MVENGFGYDLDGKRDLGTIIMFIYKHTEGIYNELLGGKQEVRNFPSEMKEVMSLIYMITASKAFLAREGVGGPVS